MGKKRTIDSGRRDSRGRRIMVSAADAQSVVGKKDVLASYSIEDSPLDDYGYDTMHFVDKERFIKETDDLDVVKYISMHGDSQQKRQVTHNPLLSPEMVDYMVNSAKIWELRSDLAKVPGISEKAQKKLISHGEEGVLSSLAKNPTVSEETLFELSKFRVTNWNGRRKPDLMSGVIKNVMDNPNVSDRCFNRIHDEAQRGRGPGATNRNMKMLLMSHSGTPGNILRDLYEGSNGNHSVQRVLMNNPNTPSKIFSDIVDNPGNEHIAAELISLDRTTPEQALKLKNDPSEIVQEAYAKRFGE